MNQFQQYPGTEPLHAPAPTQPLHAPAPTQPLGPRPGYPQPIYPQQPVYPVPGQQPIYDQPPVPAYPPYGPYGVPQPYPQQAYSQSGVYQPGVYQPAPYAPAFQVKVPREPRRAQAEKKMNRLCLVALLQTAAAFLVAIPLTILCTVVGVDPIRDNLAYQLLTAAMVPLSTTLPFLVYMKVSHADTTEYLRFEKVGFFTGLLCVLAGLGICMAANFPAAAIREFFGIFGYEPMETSLGGETADLPMFFLEISVTAILVPVMEELAYRGVLCSALRKHGDLFAILGSGFVFALAHLDFSSVVFAFIAGVTFGFLYCRTGNLWVSIVIHMLNNGIAVANSYAELLFGSQAELFGWLSMLVPLALGLLALILLAIFRRKQLFYRQKRAPNTFRWALSAKESFGSIARAPLFWVLVAMSVCYTATLFA